MRDLLRADLYRMFRKRWFWLCVGCMEAIALVLIVVQRTAMDYAVSIDRVVFLPMAFYGVAVAALVSLYVGDDYHDGMIRNKIIAGRSRSAIYFSLQTACWLGCLAVYAGMALTTVCIGSALFSVTVTLGEILRYALLGACTCLAYGSLFGMISVLARNKSAAVTLCMALAFAMLFLCLHTNQTLMQAARTESAANPFYGRGAKRILYLVLHDLNPSGQAAQLSSMQCLHALRFLAMDLLWVCASVFAGPRLLQRMDIR